MNLSPTTKQKLFKNSKIQVKFLIETKFSNKKILDSPKTSEIVFFETSPPPSIQKKILKQVLFSFFLSNLGAETFLGLAQLIKIFLTILS
jgi:hypothetical protein